MLKLKFLAAICLATVIVPSLQAQSPAAVHQKQATEQQALIKETAVSVLRNIIDQTTSVKDLQTEATVIARAAELVWNRDEAYARDSLKRAIVTLIQEYSSKDAETKNSSQDLNRSILILIKGLARRDSTLALSLLKQYETARAEAFEKVSASQTLKEKFEVIRETLSLDTAESARLAANLLKTGIPSTFPQYLYDLRAQNPEVTDELYRAILSYLSAGATYSSSSLNYLSIYPFRETAIIMPIVDPGSKKPSLAIFTTPLSLKTEAPDLNLARAFVTAMYSHLARAGSIGPAEPATVAQHLFIALKLNGYVKGLRLDEPQKWQQLCLYFETLARSAGFDDANLKYIAGYAERIASNQLAFLFDSGASLFEKARNTQDPKQQTAYPIRAIKELIEDNNFTDSEKRISDLSDEDIKRGLTDYLNYRAAEVAMAKRDWPTVSIRSEKISDPCLRALVLLKSTKLALSTTSSKDRKRASEFVEKAVDDVSKLTDHADKARGYLTAAAILARLDAPWSLRLLGNAIDSMNKAENYDGSGYTSELTISDLHLHFGLSDSELETNIRDIAQTDWLTTLSSINRITASVLRHRAQLGACRAILT